MRQLVGGGEVEPLLLGAVAQGGVVDVEGAVEVHLLCSLLSVGCPAFVRQSDFETGRAPLARSGDAEPSSIFRPFRGFASSAPGHKKTSRERKVGASAARWASTR